MIRENGGFAIYKWKTDRWVKKPGGANAITVAPDGNPCVTTFDGKICRYNGSNFIQMPGLGIDIAASADGYIYIAGRTPTSGGYLIYRWQGNSWTRLSGGGINIGALEMPYGPIVTNDNSKIHTWLNFAM